MIKTDNNIIYITGGDCCYITRVENGSLEHVGFGKRIEPEDDITVLTGASAPAYEVKILKNGKPTKIECALVDMAVEQKAVVTGMPTLRGGKTLKVRLADSNNGVELELYYTSFPRGGIARRTVVKNIGESPIELSSVMCGGALCAGGEACDADSDLVVVTATDTSERQGNAFGLCMIYGGSRYVKTTDIGGAKNVSLGLDFGNQPYVLEAGEQFISPEVLIAYSENGVGGLMRVFHDILREQLIPEHYNRRRPMAVYDPFAHASDKNLDKKAVAAFKLGADTFIVNADKIDDKTLRSLSALAIAAAENGIHIGVKISFDETIEPYSVINRLVGAGVKLVKWNFSGALPILPVAAQYDNLKKLYTALEKATDNPELILESASADLGALAYCMTVCVYTDCADGFTAADNSVFPLCARDNELNMVSDSELSFKSRFDMASLGILGYALDPLSSEQGVANAVRAQVFSYQDDAELVQSGDLYRSKVATSRSNVCMTVVSKDKSKAYAVFLKRSGKDKAHIKFDGLDEHNLYHVRELDKTFSGAALKSYGLPVPDIAEGVTLSFHLRQVADFYS